MGGVRGTPGGRGGGGKGWCFRTGGGGGRVLEADPGSVFGIAWDAQVASEPTHSTI